MADKNTPIPRTHIVTIYYGETAGYTLHKVVNLTSILLKSISDRYRNTAAEIHHYENMPIQIDRKFHLQKTEHFQIKSSYIFQFSAQNIDCRYPLEPPRRGGSNEYSQSMFLSGNKKNNVYPCKPQFYYIKVGFKGGQYYIGMFSWWVLTSTHNLCFWAEKRKIMYTPVNPSLTI